MALSVALLASLNAAVSRLGSGTVQAQPPVIVDPPEEGGGEEGPRTITVTNQTQLNAAIADLQAGDLVELVYNATPYNLDMTSKAPASEVTFAMKEGESTAPVIAEMDLTSCQNMRFVGLRWAAPATISGTTDDNLVMVYQCSSITFSDCEIDGGASAYWNGSTGLGWSGMRFQDCIGITVEKCHVHHVAWSVRFFSCSNTTFGGEAEGDGNRVERMQKDGVFFVGQCGATTIKNNVCGDPLGTDYDRNHGDLLQISTTGATAPVGPFVIEDNILATCGKWGYQGLFTTDDASVRFNGFYARRNLIQTRSTLGLVIRSMHTGDISANICVLDPNAGNPGSLPTYGTPAIDARDTQTGLSGITCQNNASQSYNGMGVSGLTASGNQTISSRNSYVNGIDGFNDLDDFVAATTAAGYGPSWMQAA